MTKRQTNLWVFLMSALTFVSYLMLLNIDLNSDAQASIAYLFYGPPGLIPSFFAGAFTKILLGVWYNKNSAGISWFNVLIAIVCVGLAVGPLIYVGIYSGSISL